MSSGNSSDFSNFADVLSSTFWFFICSVLIIAAIFYPYLKNKAELEKNVLPLMKSQHCVLSGFKENGYGSNEYIYSCDKGITYNFNFHIMGE